MSYLKVSAAVIGVLATLLSMPLEAQVIVTPGSASAYAFCPKGKATCPVSATGRWLFQLQHESAVDPSKIQDAFRDNGTGPNRLRYNTGPIAEMVQNRFYIGYGEFKINASDPTKGTFSGIVDLPPIPAPPGCPAYGLNYCTMSGPTNASTSSSDTPFRYCWTRYGWSSAGGPNANTGTNWGPNTGVMECKNPLNATFGAYFGTGAGNCVAYYVERRGSAANISPLGAFQLTEYLYQARVHNLQIKQAYDFDDTACTLNAP